MARNTATFTATYGRDRGKVYHLTEMLASQGEWWATRALTALGSGEFKFDALDIATIASSGMEGVAMVAGAKGANALMTIPPQDSKPLLDEMMACIAFMPETKIPRPLLEEDIEEVLTRIQLRDEVLKLHLGFSMAEKFRTWGVSAKAMLGNMRNTQASPAPLEPLSAADAPPSES